jgi:hypothetical protein
MLSPLSLPVDQRKRQRALLAFEASPYLTNKDEAGQQLQQPAKGSYRA